MSVALHPIVNSLTGYLNGVPQISTRDTQTTVHLHDNETLVIGGLIQENTQRTESKVPLVGDIPLLGRIFRNTNTTNTRNELIIVVTPHVLGIAGTTVPNAALPPGMTVPTPRPLPTLAPASAFRSSARPRRRRRRPPCGLPAARREPECQGQRRAQPGSGRCRRHARAGAAQRVRAGEHLRLRLAPGQHVRRSGRPTTDLLRHAHADGVHAQFDRARQRDHDHQRAAPDAGSGTSSISLSPVSPGTWQGIFSANVLGLPPT